MALNPARFRNSASVLAPGPNGTDEVPRTLPELSQSVMETVTGTTLGFAMATEVVKLVSSQMSVLLVRRSGCEWLWVPQRATFSC